MIGNGIEFPAMLAWYCRRVAGLMIAAQMGLVLCSLPARFALAQTTPQTAANGGTQLSALAPLNAEGSPSATSEQSVRERIKTRFKAGLTKINPMRLLRDGQYKKAAALLPSFCRHWEELLHERELNNLNHLDWVLKDGYQTAIYTGYGKVESCTCKQSAQGFAIGTVKYQEKEYYLVGQTRDAAQHAKPQTVHSIATTELFRWDKGKWFY